MTNNDRELPLLLMRHRLVMWKDTSWEISHCHEFKCIIFLEYALQERSFFSVFSCSQKMNMFWHVTCRIVEIKSTGREQLLGCLLTTHERLKPGCLQMTRQQKTCPVQLGARGWPTEPHHDRRGCLVVTYVGSSALQGTRFPKVRVR